MITSFVVVFLKILINFVKLISPLVGLITNAVMVNLSLAMTTAWL